MFARPYFCRRRLTGTAHQLVASHIYAPCELPAAYGWPSGVTVAPLTIVIGELGGAFYHADVAPWAVKAGVPAPVIEVINLPGADVSPSDADGEVALDWQCAAQAWSYLTGLPAHIVLINGPNSGKAFADVVNAANALPGVGGGSWSWGSAEDQWSDQERSALAAAVAASQYPWCAASGDNGSNDGTSIPDVDCPACLPCFVGCGGTSRPPNGVEVVWNGGDGSGTGGGFSRLYSRPPWQPASDQGAGRMVPDLAAVADPATGYAVLLGGEWGTVGGTSAVAPLMAGFLAAVNGVRVLAGLGKIAQANAFLWAASSAFLDITSGTNGSYRATAGPDPCSGLGRPLGTLFSLLAGTGQVPPVVPPVQPPVSLANAVSSRVNAGIKATLARVEGVYSRTPIVRPLPLLQAILAPLQAEAAADVAAVFAGR